MLEAQIECQKVRRKQRSTYSFFSSPNYKLPPRSSPLTTHHRPLKALINRLEKNRGIKPEERANVMKTLKELTEKITQLQNEMNAGPASRGPAPGPNQPKTKTDVWLAPPTASRCGKWHTATH